jgi:hypothetical protein
MSTRTMLSACGKSKIYRMILELLDDEYDKRRRWVARRRRRDREGDASVRREL